MKLHIHETAELETLINCVFSFQNPTRSGRTQSTHDSHREYQTQAVISRALNTGMDLVIDGSPYTYY
jgi:hypothetical protein